MLKYQVESLFDGERIHQNQAIIIDENTGLIEAVFTQKDVPTDFIALNGLVCPSFINSHNHLELSHLKAQIPKGTKMITFLESVVEKRQYFSKEAILQHIETALQEVYQTGTCFVGDICNTTDTISLKKSIQGIDFYNFIEVIDYTPKEERKQYYHAVLDEFRENHLRANLTAHSPYLIARETFEHFILDKQTDILSIHQQESAEEEEFYNTQQGALVDFAKKMKLIQADQIFPNTKSNIFFQSFLPEQTILFVHNVFISKQQLDEILNLNIDPFFCFCPRANQYINGILPNIDQYYGVKDKVVLGTDSLASNDDLNIFNELMTLAKYSKKYLFEDLLKMITSNASKLFGLNDGYGYVKKGNRARLNRIEYTNNPKTIDKVKKIYRLF